MEGSGEFRIALWKLKGQNFGEKGVEKIVRYGSLTLGLCSEADIVQRGLEKCTVEGSGEFRIALWKLRGKFFPPFSPNSLTFSMGF